MFGSNETPVEVSMPMIEKAKFPSEIVHRIHDPAVSDTILCITFPALVTAFIGLPANPVSIRLTNAKLLHHLHNSTIALISDQSHQSLPYVFDLIVLVK